MSIDDAAGSEPHTAHAVRGRVEGSCWPGHGVPVRGRAGGGRPPPTAVAAADAIGYPVVAKLCGDGIAHKTERGLVRLGLGRRRRRCGPRPPTCSPRPRPTTARSSVLVAPDGARQPRADRRARPTIPQFGMTVMLGVGGILAEAVADVTIRLVPIERVDAEEMIDDLAHPDAARRVPRRAGGRPRRAGRRAARPVGRAAIATPELVSADLNPLIVVDGRPVAVDALVEVASRGAAR